jgi:hypothetical protein
VDGSREEIKGIRKLVWLLLRLLPRVSDKVKEAKGNEEGTTLHTVQTRTQFLQQ